MIPSSLPVTVAYLDTCRTKVRKELDLFIYASVCLYVSKVNTIEAIILPLATVPGDCK